MVLGIENVTNGCCAFSLRNHVHSSSHLLAMGLVALHDVLQLVKDIGNAGALSAPIA